MIHVCFGLYDKTGRYSKFTGTTITSIFENTNTLPPSITVHILHDNTLSDENREKFIYVAGRYGQIVKFYNVEKTCADKIAEIRQAMPAVSKSTYSIATFYRFFISQLLPEVDKVIYLDSDIIVRLDIAELWRVDLGDKPFGAVPTILQNSEMKWLKGNFPLIHDGIVLPEDYFNAGVLLMNLNFFRTETATVMDGVKFIAEHPAYQFFDQDVLNYCFATRYLKLPVKFNQYVWCDRLNKATFAKKIYHYVGPTAVWSYGLDMSDRFNQLWTDYFVKTPWFDASTIEHLYEGIRRLNVDLKQSQVQLSAMLSGKTRAFVTLPQNLEATKQIFMVRDNEEIISIGQENGIPKILDAMKRARGKKVFFVLLPNFPFEALTQAGFVYGKDFFNGLEFLSDANGMPLDSHLLLKAM